MECERRFHDLYTKGHLMKQLVVRIVSNWALRVLPVSHFYELKRLFLNYSGINVEKNCKVNGRTQFFGRGRVSFASDSWIGPNCIFYTHPDAEISIGSNCDVAPGVIFITGGHDIGGQNRRAGTGWAKPIWIGDGCWIGSRVTILGGVRVGPGVVIAAGAVVVCDVPENCLVGGVPAKILRKLHIQSEVKNLVVSQK